MKKTNYLLSILLLFLAACQPSENSTTTPNNTPDTGLKTKHVVVLVIDGPRFSESFGDTSREHIPNLTQLASEGVFYPNFLNNGVTYTNPGHTAISTGIYQHIDNTGLEIPQYPSMFQYYLKHSGDSANQAWVIASKDKLETLADCQQTEYAGRFNPMTDCGINGNGTGYRSDLVTIDSVKNILGKHLPKLTLINYRQPDYAGHGGNFENYLNKTEQSDSLALVLWDFIQSTPGLANETSLFITNDHGRHLDDVADGFVSHGDDCAGCKRISLIALGPDFVPKQVEQMREQIDIPTTIAHMFNFDMPTAKGHVMTELFE